MFKITNWSVENEVRRRFDTTPRLVSVDRSPRLWCRSKLKTRKFGTISHPQAIVFRLAYRAGRKLINVAYLAVETLSLPLGHLFVYKKFKHNTAAPSPKHCSNGKAVSLKYWVRVSVAVVIQHADGFGGLVVSMLASGTQVCGFKPGRSRWIFRT